jgi:hypothetical protein
MKFKKYDVVVCLDDAASSLRKNCVYIVNRIWARQGHVLEALGRAEYISIAFADEEEGWNCERFELVVRS